MRTAVSKAIHLFTPASGHVLCSQQNVSSPAFPLSSIWRLSLVYRANKIIFAEKVYSKICKLLKLGPPEHAYILHLQAYSVKFESCPRRLSIVSYNGALHYDDDDD